MTMLKFQNRNVLEFDFDKMYLKIIDKDFLPIVLRDSVVDLSNINDKSNTKESYEKTIKIYRQNISSMNYFF